MKQLIFLIIDGMADDPHGDLLAKANIPHLDYLAQHGKVGSINILDNKAPESDVAIVRLFGYPTETGYPGRGPLEALGAGVIGRLETGYLAWRANFATLAGNSDSVFEAEILDSRVERTLTSKHAEMLADYLNRSLSSVYQNQYGIEINLYPTVEHRAVVVYKGKNLSSEVTNTDPFYKRFKDGTTGSVQLEHPRMTPCLAFEDKGSGIPSKASIITAGITNDYAAKCYALLKDYRIQEREEYGLKNGNAVLMRNAGSEIINLKRELTLSWAAHVGMPMERGIAIAGDMTLSTFEYPAFSLDLAVKAKDNPIALYEHVFTNLDEEIKQYNDFLTNGFAEEAAWLHCKPLDIAGHDGLIGKKREMLERIDETIIKQIRDLVDSGGYAAVITSDHATVCQEKKHTSDNVPVLIAGLGDDGYSEAFSENVYRCSPLKLTATELFDRGGQILTALKKSCFSNYSSYSS